MVKIEMNFNNVLKHVRDKDIYISVSDDLRKKILELKDQYNTISILELDYNIYIVDYDNYILSLMKEEQAGFIGIEIVF